MKSSLRTAVEMMARENIDMLPVVSEEKNIIGIVSYKDIIAAYKYNIEDHVKKYPSISLKRNSLKILIRGQKLISAIKSTTDKIRE
jgi:predicted transcriptional regulator